MPATTTFTSDGKSATFNLAEALSSAQSVLGVTVNGSPVAGVFVGGKPIPLSSVTVDGKPVPSSVAVEGVAVTLPEAPADDATVAITHLSAAVDGAF